MDIIEMRDKKKLKKKGELFINFGLSRNNEDAGSVSYDREYLLYPYNSKLPDEMIIDHGDLQTLKVKGVTLPFATREDKIAFELYGTSDIEGSKKYYIRRVKEKKIVKRKK